MYIGSLAYFWMKWEMKGMKLGTLGCELCYNEKAQNHEKLLPMGDGQQLVK